MCAGSTAHGIRNTDSTFLPVQHVRKSMASAEKFLRIDRWRMPLERRDDLAPLGHSVTRLRLGELAL